MIKYSGLQSGEEQLRKKRKPSHQVTFGSRLVYYLRACFSLCNCICCNSFSHKSQKASLTDIDLDAPSPCLRNKQKTNKKQRIRVIKLCMARIQFSLEFVLCFLRSVYTLPQVRNLPGFPNMEKATWRPSSKTFHQNAVEWQTFLLSEAQKRLFIVSLEGKNGYKFCFMYKNCHLALEPSFLA